MPSWICHGVARDGKQRPYQNPPGAHAPQENYGNDCVICSLKREDVQPPSDTLKIILALGITVGILGGLGYGIYQLLQPKPCPAGQTKINGVCVIEQAQDTDKGGAPVTGKTPSDIGRHKTLAEVPNVPNMIVRYGGSTSFAPLRTPEIEGAILQAHPGFRLIYLEPPPGEKPGSGSGIRMLIEGQISVAQSSRALKDEEFARAQTRGFTLEQVPVALDGIVIYVNPQLSLPGLTVSQVKDIFTGKLTNWSQVGGPNLAIKPFSRDPKDGGTPEYFEEKILNKEAFAPSIKPYVRDTTDSLRKVAKTPGGIGYATASEVCNQSSVKPMPLAKVQAQTFVSPCNGKDVNLTVMTDNSYAITRRLFVIIRRDGGIDEQAGVAYVNMLLSNQGQQMVEQAGLIPLHSN